MGDVVRFKKPKLSEKYRGSTLCRNGHHKWEVVKENQFDVKQGRLVTLYKCKRCGRTKSKLL